MYGCWSRSSASSTGRMRRRYSEANHPINANTGATGAGPYKSGDALGDAPDDGQSIRIESQRGRDRARRISAKTSLADDTSRARSRAPPQASTVARLSPWLSLRRLDLSLDWQ